MSLTASERDKRASGLLEALFKKANPAQTHSLHLSATELDQLFSTNSWGLRELLLLISIARLLDNSYQPTKSLYACNPRPLYEGPIRTALKSRGIPTRQSGALNVAKATVSINSQWAEQRQSPEVAALVVTLAQRIESLAPADLEQFTVTLLSRFLREAKRIANLTVNVSPNSDPIKIYNLCRRLIAETPDGGNTPQRIVGYLLESYHEVLNTGITVAGHLDSASTTNTTSKKPGDILETLADGTIAQIIEVTVKPFNHQRIDESFSSVSTVLGDKHSEIIVICREADAPAEASDETDSYTHLGSLEYKGLSYQFIDIYEWIISQLLRMPPKARASFYDKLQAYISDPNTSEKVKVLWRELHS